LRPPAVLLPFRPHRQGHVLVTQNGPVLDWADRSSRLRAVLGANLGSEM
jgi:hypothetical protein